MDRTTRYKIQYVALFVVLGGVALFVASLFDWSPPALFAVALVLLIPGRVQGHYYRDLFQGRRALDVGDLDASVNHTERFLTTIRSKPGLKWMMWLGGVVYTADPEAMALNNLGAANLEAARLEVAESAFNAAIRVDPLYPIPFYNLAVLSEAGGDRAEAERYLLEAEKRGYTRNGIDRVIHQAQALLAKVEGQSAAAGAA